MGLARQQKHGRSAIAYCTALTVNAVRSKRSIGAWPGQIDHSHEFGRALKVDMSNWWQPTAKTYLGRVSKEQIIEALREADKLRPYDVADMKKPQLTARAEKQLAGSGWLPAILRAKEAAQNPGDKSTRIKTMYTILS